MTGAEVEKYYRDGHIREIAEYCESDVVQYLSGLATVRTLSWRVIQCRIPGERSVPRGFHQGTRECEGVSYRSHIVACLINPSCAQSLAYA